MSEFKFDETRHLALKVEDNQWVLEGRRGAVFASGYCSYKEQAPMFLVTIELHQEGNTKMSTIELLAWAVPVAREFLTVARGTPARDFDAIALIASAVQSLGHVKWPPEDDK